MTFDEFKEKFENKRAKVICHNISERNEVLRFLDRCGYILGEKATEHIYGGLKDQFNDPRFLFPGLVSSEGIDIIGCYRVAHNERIRFEEISDLIYDEGEDQTDDAEVQKALFEVLCGI